MIRNKIITVADLEIAVTRRTGQKNLYIRVSPPDGDISVSAPVKIPDKVIKNFILRKIPEIMRARERISGQFRQTKREYISGETCYYWGKPYMLQIVIGRKKSIARVPNKIIMTVPNDSSFESRRKLLTEWYRSELRQKLPVILLRCEKRIGVKASSFAIRNMKTRWGSCNILKRKILVNLQLVKKPIECLEYVLTHELVHLIERNHTQKFKSLVAKYYPSWREAKQLLEEYPLEHWEK